MICELVSASDGTLHADVENPCFDFFFHVFWCFKNYCYLCSVPFAHIGCLGLRLGAFLLKIESFYFKSFCAIDNTNYNFKQLIIKGIINFLVFKKILLSFAMKKR